MIWIPVFPPGPDELVRNEEGIPVPPWLPWLVFVLALVTSGFALRALFCAS